MYHLIKRLVDIVFSLILIVLLFPIFIVIIIILKFSGDGEVFYLQERVGYKNKNFKIYKFATMIKNSPNLGSGDVTLRNDPRVTYIGKYLRKSKINELPQIINVLFGDITLVGPRPLMKPGFDRYALKFQKNIYNIKPGLTGIGSIIFRDEEKIMTDSNLPPHECYEKIILPYKGKLELWYQNKQNSLLDIQIIFMTVWIILFPKSKLYQRWFNDLPK